MAPASVLPEHCAMKVVKCKITTVDGLRAAGVRIVGSEELAELLLSFRGQDKDDNSETLADDEPIGLPKGEWTGKGWKHAVYVPGKAGKKKPWEDSYARFKAGEDQLTGAFAGAHPYAATASGVPVDLPDANGKRDGSGTPLDVPVHGIGGAVHVR